ncbi:hypothetical protein A2W24_02455 [Microgenomates group bacterium RBG_16_45_19]|nr:MAG: hypothetical protein A2W24_02455 [Microgenomates group bacterium RBG_16_45_19]
MPKMKAIKLSHWPVAEVRLIGLILAVVVLLTVGLVYQGLSRQQSGRQRLHWGLKLDLSQKLQVRPNQEPYLMNLAELTRERVVYNLLTKTGFRELGWLSVIGLGLVYLGAQTGVWAWQWSWQRLVAMNQLAKSWARAQVSLEIAGTVKISHRRGMIYVSRPIAWTGRETEGEVFGLSWLPIKVRVETSSGLGQVQL